MAEKYDGIERYIFADLYNFFLKYKDMPNTDYYWQICLDDAKVLRFKYMEHPVVTGMIAQVITQIEHKVTGRTLSNLSHEQWEEKLKLAKKMGW